jgi:hypothetical protein
MRKRLSLLLLSATMGSGIAALADAPPRTRQVELNDTQSAPAATTLRMRGTIDRYDASTRILSLSTANGTMRLVLASTARIRQGWHKLDPIELRKLVGYRAAVGYSESDGNKTVESVHVFGKNERIER